MASEVRYALTLESRQFIQELAKARQSAKDTARQVKDGGEEAGGGLKTLGEQFKDTQRLGMGFAAAQNALAQAMSGNFVGAATSAAKAMSALTSTMLANPILMVVAAIAAVGVALYNAAKGYEEYRQRCAEAREENERFRRSLGEIASARYNAREQRNYENSLSAAGGGAIKDAIREQEKVASEAYDKALAAAKALQEAQSQRDPDEKQIEALKERRDAAKAEYAEQQAILDRYKDLLDDWKDKQKQAQEEEKKNAEEIAAKRLAANQAELQRQEYESAKDDKDKLLALAAKRQGEADAKWGDEDDYQRRLRAGTATEEEIKARKEIADMQARVLALSDEADIKQQSDDAKAAAQAQKDASDAERLARSREAAMVRAGDAKGLMDESKRLTKEADEKYGKWTKDRIGTATQEELDTRADADRLRKEAKSIVDARRKEAEDKAKAAAKEEEKNKQKPWVEGVVAARGMSLGDVFNNMRGMNGAAIRDPNLEAVQSTAKNTNEMKTSLDEIKKALKGEGVK